MKCAYLINFGLEPYFHESLTRDINQSPFYSYSFEESMNSVLQNCQMVVVIHYWVGSNNVTQTQYLDSKFLNRPNTEELLSSICESLTNLREDKLPQLSMDGPAVNWKVFELFEEKLESKGLPKTLNIGGCSQHSAHGALKMGLRSVD